MNLEKLFKTKITKGTKQPCIKNWTHPSNFVLNIDNTKYDAGIITGKANNLIVLDIDIKDNGLIEFENYIKLNGSINTFIVKTPSGGYHYYFTYQHSNASVYHLINNTLTNRSKFRGVGLDIRTNGGQVIAPNTIRDGKKYEITSNIEPIEISEHLILWLLEQKPPIILNKNSKKVIKLDNNETKLKYNITTEELQIILNKLDKTYYDNYSNWLIVLSVCKGLNQYEMFDKFSKKSIRYDETNNLLIWNANKGNIDINYLILKMNTEQMFNIKPVEKFKLLTNEYKQDNFIKMNMNKKHLKYDAEIFEKNDTIVINSTTGSGKTTNTAHQCFKYIVKYPEIKIISLVNIIKLAEQQIKTFNDEKITLLNYQNCNALELIDNNIICCLNSIHNKLNGICEDEFKNYIVYIDEITSFIDSFLFNDKLNAHLKLTYLKLIKLIKNCHKLIVSDALINDNVFEFIKVRKTKNNLYITNEFKKYQDVKAVRHNDEFEFLKTISEHIEADNYFLFGSDSNKKITNYYNLLIEKFDNKTDKFLLITSDTFIKIADAQLEFKNKFVFYSPSIITGIDFSIDECQDVFIFIKGNTISPASSFQQGTRTRNIKKLYYCSSSNEHDAIYNSVEDVKTSFRNKIDVNEKMLNICNYINEQDEMQLIENTFFNIYCNGIYTKDTEQTNKLLHFENILMQQGFNLSVVGEKASLNKKLLFEMKNITDEQLNLNFDNYVNSTIHNDILNDDALIPMFKKLLGRQDALKITNDELQLYKNILVDEFLMNSVFNIFKMFNTSSYIQEHILKMKNDNMIIKNTEDQYNKILLLRQFEIINKIQPFDLNFKKSKNVKIGIDDEQFKLLSNIFRITKDKPKSINELQILYVGILKNLFGSFNILKNKRITENKIKFNVYSFDKLQLENIFKLVFRMNTKYIDKELIKNIGIEFIENLNVNEYNSEIHNKYLFGKNK